MTDVTIVNFSHPLTDDQLAGIERRIDGGIARVINVPTHFDHNAPFEAQVPILVEMAGLATQEWETAPVLVNPPALASGALVLIAYLHGLMGHFPTIIRIMPDSKGPQWTYTIAEVVGLDVVRLRSGHRVSAGSMEEESYSRIKPNWKHVGE